MSTPLDQHTASAELMKGVREVTPDEIEFFRANGWVRLEGLVQRELADELFRHMRHVVEARAAGDDGYVDERMPGLEDSGYRSYVGSTNLRESDSFISEMAVSPRLGAVAADLLGARPLRLFSDAVFFKPRATAEGTTGPGTLWHQDYPSMPFDRAIACGIWIAAVEITPDMGSLQYLSGSHREPPLGKGAAFGTPNGATDVYPWLLERYEVSPAFHLMPGDALVHHCMTMHYSSPNRSTTADRWAWTTQRFHSATGYNGAPNHRTDGRGLVLDQPFDHPLFPVVAS